MSILAIAITTSAAATCGPHTAGAELPAFPPTRSQTSGRQVEIIDTAREAATDTGWFITRTPPADAPGRVWLGGTLLGSDPRGTDPRFDPAADRLGAAGETRRVPVRVGQTVVSLDPFVPLNGAGVRSLERARQNWLARRGYTGGVRTFVNPRTPAPANVGDHPVTVIRAPVRTKSSKRELLAANG
ncbi:MAG: hypothetical protein AAF297_12460 [Planctomycetota bacterium]